MTVQVPQNSLKFDKKFCLFQEITFNLTEKYPWYHSMIVVSKMGVLLFLAPHTLFVIALSRGKV